MLKRAAAGQSGKKRRQHTEGEQTPEGEDEAEKAEEAAEGAGGARQASTRPAQPHSRRKKQRQRAQQEEDPPTPAGPDPAAAAKGRGAAAVAAAHHAAGALTLLASQPDSSGPDPAEPSRPLHPEASWPLQYARLQFLLAESGVAEAEAQVRKPVAARLLKSMGQQGWTGAVCPSYGCCQGYGGSAHGAVPAALGVVVAPDMCIQPTGRLPGLSCWFVHPANHSTLPAPANQQDFKWKLLELPEMQQRMHFIELQARHAA